MKYIRGLDVIRAFAIIIVIIDHWALPFRGVTADFLRKKIFPVGLFGVDLFFVLSGFLITSILLEARKDEGKTNITIIKNFIARRSLRIFPIYYLALFFVWVIHYPFVREHIAWFLTYTSNILSYRDNSWNAYSHTWSLAVEEQFYLIWPWLILYSKEKYLKYIFLLAILVGIITCFVTVYINQHKFGIVLMPSCMQAFGIGGYYAYIRNKENVLKTFATVLNIIMPVAVIIHFYWAFVSPERRTFTYWERDINSIISIWLIHQIIYCKLGWVKNIAGNRLLNLIGKISYGIYLYHPIISHVYAELLRRYFEDETFLKAFLSNYLLSYLIRILILFLVSYVSFYLLEKPIMRLKDKFQY